MTPVAYAAPMPASGGAAPTGSTPPDLSSPSDQGSGSATVLLVLASAQFLMTLDTSVMNVSIRQVAADLGRGGARLGLPRLGHETLTAYGSRLAAADLAYAEGILSVATLVERATYAGIEPSADQISRALAFTRRFRSIPRRRPRGHAQDRAWANASSKDAPAASRGR